MSTFLAVASRCRRETISKAMKTLLWFLITYALTGHCPVALGQVVKVVHLDSNSHHHNNSQTDLTHLVVDQQSGRVYVAGLNKLYQLTSDLVVERSAVTGPQDDSIYCSARGSCQQGAEKSPTDNHNKALVVDNVERILLVCGSLFQGICEKYVLDDIGKKWPTIQVPLVPNDGSSSTVAFIAPGLPEARSHRVLYVASSHTLLGPYREEIPAISSRNLKTHEVIRARRFVQARIKIASQFLETFHIKYISGFYEDGYTYFFTIQPANAENTDEGFVSKLVRVCANDPSFESYMEVTLTCQSKGTKYNLVQSVDLIQPDKQLAERLKLFSNEKIVVAAFAASETRVDLPKVSCALCMYTMKDIVQVFERNAQLCFSANRAHRGLGFIAGAVGACPKDPRVVTDFCGEHLMIEGTIPLSTEALSVYTNERITSILATTTADNTVILVATHKGSVKKILVKTRHLALEYATIHLETTPHNFPIRSIHFDASRRFIYALTKTQIIKAAVADCSVFSTCSDCVRSQDPFCGWCTLKKRCMQQHECSSQDHTSDRSAGERIQFQTTPRKWLPFSAGECIDFISIAPQNISVAQHDTTIQLGIQGLPALPHGSYECVFGEAKSGMTANVTTTGLNCLVSPTAQLPKIPHGKDHTSVSVAVRSTETGQDFISRPIHLFDCGVHTRCRTCMSSKWGCNWCPDESTCRDANQGCPAVKSHNIISNYASAHKPLPRLTVESCPAITPAGKGTEILIPNMTPTSIRLAAKGLPRSNGMAQLECLVEIEGRSIRTVADLMDNSEDIVCREAVYSYESDEPELASAVLSVVSNGNHYVDTINVTLFKCSRKGPDCNLCLTQAAKFRCGWLDDRCQFVPGQSSVQNATCPAPSIDSIFPVSGPIEGGTVLTIVGRELGMRMEDLFGAITVAGVPCVPEEYQVSRRVLCRIKPSTADQLIPRSGSVTIDLPRRAIHTSHQKFYFLNASLSDVSPRTGPQAGGTRLTLSGNHLDIGSNISVTVGGMPCQLERDQCTSTQLVCLTAATRKHGIAASHADILVQIDDALRIFPSQYFYAVDPVIGDIEPLVAFHSGGSNLRVFGDNFDSVSAARLHIYNRESGQIINSSNCQVQSTRLTLCPAPALPASLDLQSIPMSTTVSQNEGPIYSFDISIDMDGWSSKSLGSSRQINYYPDPLVRQFPDVDHTARKLEGEPIIIEGERLDLGSREIDIEVSVGDHECTIVSLSAEHLTCLPPGELVPDQAPLRVMLKMGNTVTFVGFVQFSSTSANETQAHKMVSSDTLVGIVSGAALLLVITVVALFLYRRKSTRAEREYKRIQMQMDTLESNVRYECKQAFAELQTDISDIANDLQVSGIPYLDHRPYIVKIFFPLSSNHPVLQDLRPCRNNRCNGFEATMGRFKNLLENEVFLLTFVDALESQPTFGIRDRSNVASLVMTVMLDKMDYFTQIFKHLLVDLMDRSVMQSRHPQLMLRRSESVVEKMMSNWIALSMFDYLHGPVGNSLFLLFQALKHQVEKGPVDYMTHEARYSLSEACLLRQQVDYRYVIIHLHQDDFENTDVQKLHCRVLDCDSISQVKAKLLDALYKTSPASSRPSVYEIDLEWHSRSSRIILQDEDATSMCHDGWRKLNTLAHYGIVDSAVMTLVLKSQDSGCGVTYGTTSNCEISPYSVAVMPKLSHDYAGKVWHLTKPLGTEYHVPDQMQYFATLRAPATTVNDWSQAQRNVPEVFLTRLLSTKGTLQKYIDDLFHLILSARDDLPVAVKWLFDLYDDYGRRYGSVIDSDVVHTWKSNSLPLRFWVNMIKNPEFLFDVQKTPTLDACMSVVAQIFMDSCSSSDQMRLGKDSPSSKLLFAKDIPQYRGMVKKYYSHIATMPNVDARHLSESMNTLSKKYGYQLNTVNALKELFAYAIKYRVEIEEKLDELPSARQVNMTQEFENLCSSGNFYSLPPVNDHC